jgi:5-methyltetrahydrofolate--homocysteine methyltransferase
MTDVFKEIYTGVVDGNAGLVKTKVQEALDNGEGAERILKEGLIAAMKEVGQLFEDGEYFVPEMLVSARAMQTGMAVLKPALVEADIQPLAKVVIGTVKGDLHDIGKNLVSMMLEGAGFQIVDLGSDVTPEKFLEAVETHRPDIVAMSALLTTTMTNMGKTIQALKDAGVKERVKIMVGGAPVTQKFASDIGADGYAPDASQAAALAKTLVGAA